MPSFNLTLSAVALTIVTLMTTSLTTSGSALAFRNTIHPIRSPVVRDHRGSSNGQGGVTVVSNNPVVRDHRGNGPIVRDHRSGNPVVRDHRTKKPITCLGNLC